jgi:hypothetical protein
MEPQPYEGRSEVARLRWAIQQQCEALRRVMNDPAFSASHAVIQRRYLALNRHEQQLASYIGAERAQEVLCDIYQQVVG